MEETDFEVTNNDILIFLKLICLLRYKLLCSSDIFLDNVPTLGPFFLMTSLLYSVHHQAARGIYSSKVRILFPASFEDTITFPYVQIFLRAFGDQITAVGNFFLG